MKKYKFSIILLAMVLVVIFSSAGVIALSRSHSEGSVNAFDGKEYDSELFKDHSCYSTAAAKALCEEFDLDYDTLTYEEYYQNRDYVDYFSAASLKLDYGKNRLLKQLDADSLESYCDDVYAFKGAKEIIEEICKRDGIDAATAVIDDLTLEQIMEIETKCYETSDHPKN